MEGANAQVDPEAEDRKGGAGDLAKIFFAAGDHNLAILAHMPPEQEDKCSLQDFMGYVGCVVVLNTTFWSHLQGCTCTPRSHC